MKKMVLVFALAALALGGSAFAQTPYQNNIGIYFDEAGTNNCAFLPVGSHPAYVVLTKLTAGDVLGWEAKLTYDNLFPSSLGHRGQAVDVGSRPGEAIVGFASPLPAVGGTCVVADVDILVINADPGYAFVGEVYFSLLENGLPAYIDGDSNGYALHPSLGGTSDPILIVNGDCSPVAVEDASFGAVKSLYR